MFLRFAAIDCPRATRAFLALAACGCSPAASDAPLDAGPSTAIAALDLTDPASCAGCHADAFRQWSTSMHAAAADDPLFVAMNARAQRETHGALGTFCVRCHAPLAAQTGATKDGTDLAALPAKMRGVTCFVCHTVRAVDGAHNDALTFGQDGVMRAAIADPSAAPHGASYSPLYDRAEASSAGLCGSCHDVQMPNGLALETTYAQWSASPYATGSGLDPTTTPTTCSKCHMSESQGAAAVGGPSRRVHDHSAIGIDTSLVPLDAKAAGFAGADAGSLATAATATNAVQASLDAVLDASLCVNANGASRDVIVTLSNPRAGHEWPTGATHDRRAWVAITAWANGQVVFDSDPADGEGGVSPEPGRGALALGTSLFDADGGVTLFSWNAQSKVDSLLAPATSLGSSSSGTSSVAPSLAQRFTVSAAVDRITTRVRATPVAREVSAALVASGDLSAEARARIPVYTLTSGTLDWTRDRGDACLP